MPNASSLSIKYISTAWYEKRSGTTMHFEKSLGIVGAFLIEDVHVSQHISPRVL